MSWNEYAHVALVVAVALGLIWAGRDRLRQMTIPEIIALMLGLTVLEATIDRLL